MTNTKTCGGCWWYLDEQPGPYGQCRNLQVTVTCPKPENPSCPAWVARPGVVDAVSGWLPGRDAPKDEWIFATWDMVHATKVVWDTERAMWGNLGEWVSKTDPVLFTRSFPWPIPPTPEVEP